MCKPICRTVAALVLMAAIVAAQTNPTSWNTVKALSPGTEVQIAGSSRTVRGKIDRVTDDTLVVTSGKGQETFTQQEVVRVSVKKPGHRKRNALIGLAVGTGAGLGIGLAADRCSGTCFGPNLNGVVTAGIAVAGALVGTIIGVAIPSGGWREVYGR